MYIRSTISQYLESMASWKLKGFTNKFSFSFIIGAVWFYWIWPIACETQWGQIKRRIGQNLSHRYVHKKHGKSKHQGPSSSSRPLFKTSATLFWLLHWFEISLGSDHQDFTGNDWCLCRKWLANHNAPGTYTETSIEKQ